MRVLIVDDVGYSRHYHSRMLQKLGYDTLTAETGPQAVHLLERDSTIDVVLTDLMMRDMDGLELFSATQAINRMTDAGHAEPPAFILMTAVRPGSGAQPKDLDKIRLAKQLGFVEVLFKPVAPEHLERTLQTVKLARGAAAAPVELDQLLQQLRTTIECAMERQDVVVAGRLKTSLLSAMEHLNAFSASR